MSYYEIYLDDELLCSSDWNDGILDANVSKEINTAGELSFTILPTHSKWDQLKPMVSKVEVLINGKNVFRGRVKDYTMDIYKQKQVTCEGALGWLVDSYCEKKTGLYPDRSWTFKSDVQDVLDASINHYLEEYKHFSIGLCEPGFYSDNLLKDIELLSGYYNTSDGVTFVSSDSDVTEADYISFDPDKKYWITAGVFDDNVAYNSRYYLYDEDKVFIATISGPPYLDKDRIKDYYDQQTADRVKFIRVSSDVPASTLFWLNDYYTDETDIDEDDEDDYETWDGGQLSDLITNWIVDGKDMLIRSRVSELGENIIDILHPGRYIASNTVEFARNIIDINLETTDLEPYSVVVPLFGDDDEPIIGFVVELEDAVAKYGIIQKCVSFGKAKPDTDKGRKQFWERMDTYIKRFNPVEPIKYTIKALDEAVIFDNEALSIIDVGDPVRVISDPHGIDRILLCIDMTLDLNAPENNEYGIGVYTPNDPNFRIERLTDQWKKSKK